MTLLSILKSELVGKYAKMTSMVSYELIEDIWPGDEVHSATLIFRGAPPQQCNLVEPIQVIAEQEEKPERA